MVLEELGLNWENWDCTGRTGIGLYYENWDLGNLYWEERDRTGRSGAELGELG